MNPTAKFVKFNVVTHGHHIVWISTIGYNPYKTFTGELDYGSFEGYTSINLAQAIESLTLVIKNKQLLLEAPEPELYEKLKVCRAKCAVITRANVLLQYMHQKHTTLEVDPYIMSLYVDIVEGRSEDLSLLKTYELSVTDMELKKKLLRFKIEEHHKVITLLYNIRQLMYEELRTASTYEDVEAAYNCLKLRTRSLTMPLSDLMSGK